MCARRPQWSCRWLLAAGLLLLTPGCEAPIDLGADLHCPDATVCSSETVLRCADLQRDPDHCGACGQRCPAALHASPACERGRCAMLCAATYSDCDRLAEDGCETDLALNSRRCGGCDVACAPDRACNDGGCTLTNLALRQPTSQSSTFGGGCRRESEFAVDGRWCGTKPWFAHQACPDLTCGDSSGTLDEESPWWEVDLGAEHAIDHVELWNALALGPFAIKVSSDHEGWMEFPFARALVPEPTVVPVRARGRWVRVQAAGFASLWIREIIVAGNP